jgi:hypothetical protein
MTERSSFILAVALLACPFQLVAAQQPGGSLSGWAGIVADSREDRWPVAPQLGVRFEGTLEGRVWLGVEASSRVINELRPCVLDGPCREQTGRTTEEVRSIFLRIELGGAQLEPYILGSWGRNPRESGLSSTVLGGAFGLRWPRLLGRFDLSAEMRHRDDDRFNSLETDMWDVMVGLHWTLSGS